jgi:hypothetical protein
MTRQNPLTLATPVKNAEIENLDTLLLEMRNGLEKGVREGFEDLGTIHYLRLVLLKPEDADGNVFDGIPTRLVLSTDYDGDEDEHLRDLATKCPAFIDKLYSHCEDYPAETARTVEGRAAYLRQWRIKSSAFFAGAPGRTLEQVKKESALRNYIWHFINSGNWKNKSAAEIHKTIKENVLAKSEFAWVKQKAELPKETWFGMALLGITLLILLPFIIIWIIILHFFHEMSDKSLGLTPAQVNPVKTRKLEEYEDLHNQNQFTQFLIMRPGFMRLKTLQGLMLFAKALISNLFVQGKLMGIPTIHFARWIMMDDNKHMLFFSNFDGSWQQYLGDFIDKSGWGLTGIWSNTVNFPKTNFLFTGGAYDAEHFLAWSRYYQIPTSVWYCAYPNLSIKNVMNNTYIRNELMETPSEQTSQKFLKRF